MTTTPSLRKVERIVAAAIQAPSGDNCQPWRFDWDGRTLTVLHDAQRAEHPLDAGRVGSELALGCVLESVEIAADAEGLQAEASLHLAEPRSPAWATIRFEPGASGRARLLRALGRRLFAQANPQHIRNRAIAMTDAITDALHGKRRSLHKRINKRG